MSLLAEVFLGDLQFVDCGCLSEAGEQWRDRFANLEIDGAVLDLYNDVVVEFSVEAFEVLNCSIGAIGVPIALVEVLVVVDKGTDEDGTTMGLKGSGKLENVSW